MLDISSIKLVIWDLDDTFWKGTLSEGGVSAVPENIDLVRDLTDRGIINSICSKNDVAPVEEELRILGADEYFVFKSVDWSPKGQRIAVMIKNMGLQPKHCLFIDDNIVNLNEAKHYSPELNICGPNSIFWLQKFVGTSVVSDKEHKRLKQYKVLEQKQLAKEKASDNLEFLFNSKTKVEIHTNCIEEIDRIVELVNRTNQLNYTKLRSSREELITLLNDNKVQSGYIKVQDRFGEYGIVGFYAMKDNVLIHFLFSCRTIGQGVEQYVYAALGYPQLTIVGDVVNRVNKETAPKWINQENDVTVVCTKKINKKVVFKGGCDMGILSSFLVSDNVIEEFGYIGQRRKNNIEHRNHSTNYLKFSSLSASDRKYLVDTLLFNDEEMFDTRMYDDDVALVFLSTMIDPNLGIYQNKLNGYKIAFGEWCYSLVDSANWNNLVNNRIFTADNQFTREWLQWFSSEYDFLGSLSPVEILDNYKQILAKVSKKTKICFLLGSELPYEKNNQKNYEGREKIYQKINTLIRDWSKSDPRVLYIDFNDYIKGQEDFTNNINHFQRRIYYEAAKKANEYISALTGQVAVQRGRFFLLHSSFAGKVAETGLFETRFWKIIRLPYTLIKPLFGLKS